MLCIEENLKIQKVMFIVDDVSKQEREVESYREKSLRYDSCMGLLGIKNKEEFSKDLSQIIQKTLNYLEMTLSSGDLKSWTLEDIEEVILKLFSEFMSGECRRLLDLGKLLNKMQVEVNNKENIMKKVAWLGENLSELILLLMRYADMANIFYKNGVGHEVKFDLPEHFEISLQQKKEDLEILIINLLEYVFLVRKVRDLNREMIANAPKKAKLYGEFDNTISLLRYRSKLIAFFCKVAGQKEEFEAYLDFANLLSQIPSRDKLTEASLVNYLITPYSKIETLNNIS